MLGFNLSLFNICSNGNSFSDNLRLRSLLLLSGFFFNSSDCLGHLSDSLDGLALFLRLAIIRLGLNLCRNLLEGLLN